MEHWVWTSHIAGVSENFTPQSGSDSSEPYAQQQYAGAMTLHKPRGIIELKLIHLGGANHPTQSSRISLRSPALALDFH